MATFPCISLILCGSGSESCIKGHRSSSCNHADRPLFEIKKKGRPVSQCTKCRQLRQSKKLHSKCTCVHQREAKEATQPLVASSTSKSVYLFSEISRQLNDSLKRGDSFPSYLRYPMGSETQRLALPLNPRTKVRQVRYLNQHLNHTSTAL